MFAAITSGEGIELTGLLILMVLVWLGGKVFRELKLPVIFGELLAGVIVGPLVLGVLGPEDHTIRVLAELGVFFMMLHTGLESNPRDIFGNSKKALLISLSGLVLTFALGVGASLLFGYSIVVALFVGMCLSATAVAVSARLFADYNMSKTSFAKISMASALVNDILTLILFSLVIELGASGEVDLVALAWITAKVTLYFAIVIFAGKKFFPQINRIIYKGNKGFTFTFIIALLFAALAELMGLHMIIGAFLAGLFIREEVIDEELFNKIEDRVFAMSYSLFGPLFFASLAFYLDFSALKEALGFLIVIVVLAVVGKVVGSGYASYKLGYSKLKSLGVGMAMNSRGAVELILAAIGLQEGIIGPEVFSVLVLMAFVTTLISIIGMKPIARRMEEAGEL